MKFSFSLKQIRAIKHWFFFLTLMGYGLLAVNTAKMSFLPYVLINTGYLTITACAYKALDKLHIKVENFGNNVDIRLRLESVKDGLEVIQKDYDDMKNIAMEEARYENYWITFKKALELSSTENSKQLSEYMDAIQKVCDEDIDKFLEEKGIS